MWAFFKLLIFTYENIDRDPDISKKRSVYKDGETVSCYVSFRSVLVRNSCRFKPTCGLESAFFVEERSHNDERHTLVLLYIIFPSQIAGQPANEKTETAISKEDKKCC